MANYSVSYLAPFAGAGHPLLPGRSQDVFFVDANHGSNDNNGKTLDRPLATITRAIALAEPTAATFNRSTLIYVSPGEYREHVDVTKPDIAIVGGAGRYPGRTRIVGDGATARATIRVAAPNLRGFHLANLFVETGFPGTASLAQPAIHLVTDDSQGGDNAQLGANHQNYHWSLDNVYTISDEVPTAGLLLAGASLGRVKDCVFAGCVHGIVLAPSTVNTPTDVEFENVRFYNNVTADITSSASAATITAGGACTPMDAINFYSPKFLDRGGTPVTNYVNIVCATATNCGIYDFWAARDVADDTLMALPANWIALGHSAAGVESIIGA